MGLVREWVEELGGFARKRELVARGALDHHLTYAVRSGDVVRVRNGWYSTREETDDALRAIRVGGRLTAASALWAVGAWMKNSRPPLHVSLPRNAARQRSQWNRRIRLRRGRKHGVTLHWDDAGVASRGNRMSVDIADALIAYILDALLEEAVAALDWALVTGELDRVDFEKLILRLPRRLRGIRDWVDDRCGSYPESIARTRLRLAGFQIRSQVPVGELESIDLLVEDVVAVEVDGREHHQHRFDQDRGKDLTITLENKHALRITVGMLRHRWPDIVRGIGICIAARGGSLPKVLSAPPRADHPTSMIGRRGEPRLPRVPSIAFL